MNKHFISNKINELLNLANGLLNVMYIQWIIKYLSKITYMSIEQYYKEQYSL